MKITRIEPLVVGAPTPGTGRLSNKNYIFVRVHTDEGITGLGEASLGGYTQTIVSLLGDLEELLIGEDPTRIEYLAQVMTRQKFWRGGVVKGSAVPESNSPSGTSSARASACRFTGSSADRTGRRSASTSTAGPAARWSRR